MSCFQAIFLPGPHSTGSGPVAWPCPVGPRNCGQLSAWANAGRIATARAAARERIDGLRGFADPAMVHIMEPAGPRRGAVQILTRSVSEGLCCAPSLTLRVGAMPTALHAL